MPTKPNTTSTIACGAPRSARRSSSPGEVTDVIHARSRGVPRADQRDLRCDAGLRLRGRAPEDRRAADTGRALRTRCDRRAALVLRVERRGPGRAGRADPVRRAHRNGRSPRRGRGAAGPARGACRAGARRRPGCGARRREQALRQRERELAEQRRILAEEYRLLRSQRAPAVPAAAPVRVQLSGSAHPAPVRFETGGRQRWWSRVKRLMLGVSAPATD